MRMGVQETAQQQLSESVSNSPPNGHSMGPGGGSGPRTFFRLCLKPFLHSCPEYDFSCVPHWAHKVAHSYLHAGACLKHSPHIIYTSQLLRSCMYHHATTIFKHCMYPLYLVMQAMQVQHSTLHSTVQQFSSVQLVPLFGADCAKGSSPGPCTGPIYDR